MDRSSLRETAFEVLKTAGLGPTTLVRETPDRADSGNAEVVFTVGALRLRFVRERGQDFLDLASGAEPERFFRFDDVELAMGWRAIGAELPERRPEALQAAIARVRKRQAELDDSFGATNWARTAVRLESAAKARGDAFLRRLRELASSK